MISTKRVGLYIDSLIGQSGGLGARDSELSNTCIC